MRRLIAGSALVVAFLICLLGGTGGPARAQSNPCAAGRADVRSLADPSAGLVDESQVIGVHVSALSSFPVPDQLPDQARFDPYETTVYLTAGRLVKAQLDRDGDIVLVLGDPDTTDTITAVLPDPARCTQSTDPTLLGLMKEARQTFVRAFGMPASDSYTPLTGQALIAGVGFIAPSSNPAAGLGPGIEIAPVLHLELDEAAQAASANTAAPGGTQTQSPQPAVPATRATAAHLYYVDVAPGSSTIYCDTDPALQRVSRRTRVMFRSLDLAIAAYPSFRLNRPC